jgi:hypothetical protein
MEPTDSRPGLRESRLPAEMPNRLDELAQATERAQFLYLSARARLPEDFMPQAEFTLSELTAVIEYVLDDGEDTQEDVIAASLRDTHGEPTSFDAIASALMDYANMAESMRDRIEAVASFDISHIGKAREMADTLRGLGQPGSDKEIAEAKQLRDQLLTLLRRDVLTIRKEARYIFRRQPEIAAQSGSKYARRLRAENRRAQQTEGVSA